MHLLVYTGQVSGRLNDKMFLRVGVLYNLKYVHVLWFEVYVLPW